MGSKRKQVEKRPHTKLDPKLVLGAMGPGMVAALAGADAGGVATYSNAGALFQSARKSAKKTGCGPY